MFLINRNNPSLIGTPTSRDIVQFVRYKDFQHSGITALSEEVLKEVPEQVVTFLMNNGIQLN